MVHFCESRGRSMTVKRRFGAVEGFSGPHIGLSPLSVGRWICALRTVLVIGLVCGHACFAQPRSREDLATRLARSTIRNLSSKAVDIRTDSLSLLAILVDASGSGMDSLQTLLEDEQAFKLVSSTAKNDVDPGVQRLAQEVRGKIQTLLALDRLAGAQRLEVAASGGTTRLALSQVDDGRLAWVQFAAEPGREYELSVGGCESVDFAVFAADGETFLTRGSAVRSRLRFGEPRQAGDLYALLNAGGSCAESIDVALSWRVPPEMLPETGDPSVAPTVTLGKPYRGRLDGKREQWLKFSAYAGANYEIATSQLTNHVDTVLDLYNDPGQQHHLAEDDDGGEEPDASRIAWLCTRTGEYFVNVRGNTGNSGSYDVMVRELWRIPVTQEIEAGADEKVAPEINPRSSAVVTFPEAMKSGWLSLSAVKGTIYRVTSNAVAQVRTPAGGLAMSVAAPVTEPEGSPLRSSFWLALETGQHPVKITRPHEDAAAIEIAPFKENESPPPQRKLSAKLNLAKEAAPVAPGTYLVTLMAEATGFARFTAEADQSYTVIIQPLDRNERVSSAIVKRGKDGKVEVLKQEHSSTSSGDSFGSLALEYSPPGPGDYFLRVKNAQPSLSRALLKIDQTTAYDGFKIGDRVVLGRHDPVNGDENWNLSMSAYVGKEAVIKSRIERDESGSYIVHVDIDNGRWQWRTRNLRRP